MRYSEGWGALKSEATHQVDKIYSGKSMIETLLQAILEQLDQPKKDVEHNLRALLNEAVAKMDLVSKDEIERQKIALSNANARLDQLQDQVRALEALIQK